MDIFWSVALAVGIALYVVNLALFLSNSIRPAVLGLAGMASAFIVIALSVGGLS